ncbi:MULTISPECIES: hypothetical protein [Arthrobacter]|uniref:Uncharacterized protein n=1 Tax=Arthrobacter terricola TaxID=2547396 RepID=A0A4V2ZSU9_9MICC|nr:MULTISPECIES: hypothetical protein [Arthrobacter]MBT8162047.1 hypothetical protein [Arthrobacter sp. GN70]TDF94564.1 hypothetical protein E1809_13510 [Arthrobacter terricola]
MKALVKEAILRCGHDGKVQNVPSQEWVRVAGSPILVDNDPQGRDISMCPNIGINIKPCNKTLPVLKGYSTFVRISGKRICLDTVEGYTDGTPPGAVKYTVRRPGQVFVAAAS